MSNSLKLTFACGHSWESNYDVVRAGVKGRKCCGNRPILAEVTAVADINGEEVAHLHKSLGQVLHPQQRIIVWNGKVIKAYAMPAEFYEGKRHEHN